MSTIMGFNWLKKSIMFYVIVIYIQEAFTCVTQSHSGTEFVFGIPENGVLSSVEPQILIYAINPNAEDAEIIIDLPNNPSNTPFPIQDTIRPYSRQIYKIAQTILSPTGTSINDRAVKVVANLDIMIQVSNNGHLTTDGFMVYPLPSLDTSYMVVSYAESLSVVPSGLQYYQGPYQMLVTGVHDNTHITIHFQFCSDPQQFIIKYKTRSYYCGTELVETLSSYYNFQIQCDIDLSGTLVVSDKPVAVFSGVYWGSIGSKGYPDYIADALLPVTSLGRSYLVPSSQFGDGYILRIIGVAGNTQVNITYNDGSTDSFDLQVSEIWTTKILINKFALIEATKCVVAAQFSMYDSGISIDDPALTILRPLCESSDNSRALVSLPYYLNEGTIQPMPTVDITLIVAEKGLPNIRVYTMVEGEGFEEYCSTFEIQESEYLQFSVIKVPFDGSKNILLYGRHEQDIYVYSRAMKWAEAHASVAGYLSSSIDSIEVQSLYCGKFQTKQFTTTPMQEIVTSDTHTTTVAEIAASSVLTTESKAFDSTPSILKTMTTFSNLKNDQTKSNTPTYAEQISEKPIQSEASDHSSQAKTNKVTTTFADVPDREPTMSLQNATTFFSSEELIVNGSPVMQSVSPIISDNTPRKTKYQFIPYTIIDIKDIHEPVESPLSEVLGGGCCLLVLIFIVAIIIIDISHLIAHLQMFISNIKSMWSFLCGRDKSGKDRCNQN